jgi:hypothetical protein
MALGVASQLDLDNSGPVFTTAATAQYLLLPQRPLFTTRFKSKFFIVMLSVPSLYLKQAKSKTLASMLFCQYSALATAFKNSQIMFFV